MLHSRKEHIRNKILPEELSRSGTSRDQSSPRPTKRYSKQALETKSTEHSSILSEPPFDNMSTIINYLDSGPNSLIYINGFHPPLTLSEQAVTAPTAKRIHHREISVP